MVVDHMECVLRQVAGLDQYIPLADAVTVDPQEMVYSGYFSRQTVKDGPSGSHVRTICLPAPGKWGKLEKTPASLVPGAVRGN